MLSVFNFEKYFYSEFSLLFSLNFFLEKSFSLLFLAVLVYILCLCIIFSILFFCKNKGLISASDFKNFNNFYFFKFLAICVLLTLAGVPPFLTFFLKSFYLLFFLKKSYLLLLLFFIFNVASMFFYLKIARLMINTSTPGIFSTFISRFSPKTQSYIYLSCSGFFFAVGSFFFIHMWVCLLNLFL